ncbi:hypothetical protein Cri9333_4708 (plasmid) [Crinalium epipsammum PCC 9333]|uniref:Uncharacterized protein n=1 Tax=Crinalium epipsammum PCC 9333 TaxID=1173022 RepID=K9W6U3_9CYAN|nr:hypothetical protein [Crinalium epipsammum]AFZ15487.1 hypothetical protein Cri9333_4708 [Crinalium epipsammum PCC 9333]
MARNRITKKLNIVDLSTAPNELPQVGGVQKTLERELNGLEPSKEKSSSPLNQGEELNGLEPSKEKSSSPLNQGEENQFRKRRGARGKQIASGRLYPYTKNKKLKNGITATYPKVEGKRNPENIDHWYWGYSYKEFVDGDWKRRTLPVPKFRVRTVREMIDAGMSVDAIKALIKGEFANS